MLASVLQELALPHENGDDSGSMAATADPLYRRRSNVMPSRSGSRSPHQRKVWKKSHDAHETEIHATAPNVKPSEKNRYVSAT